MRRSSWPGAQVSAALVWRRAARRQAAALAVLVGVCGVAAALPVGLPTRFVSWVLGFGLVALAAEAATLRYQGNRLVDGADRLILDGYRCGKRDDPTSRAVERRMVELRSVQFRRKLARDWRELLSIAVREGQIVQHPKEHISRVAVRENAPTIARIIVALEHGPGSPAAEVRLCLQWRQIPLPSGEPEQQRCNRRRFARELAAIADELSRAA